jgi:predicted alpha/beta-fold hydrolase
MTDFRPFPFLGNPHVQTVLGALWSGPRFTHSTCARSVNLPDGDRLLLHDSIPAGWSEGGRIVLVIHGLGGSHRSAHVQRLARVLIQRKARVVRIDLRGVGHGVRLARRPYHGGLSADVRVALAEMHRWSPRSPLAVIGLSLGGNLALKMAGEARENPVAGLDVVVALSPPIDFERCAALLAQPRNRFYERYYVSRLLVQVRQRERLFPATAPIHFPRRMTMRLFDDLYTAPTWGFDGAQDYYRQASALPLIEHIAVPSLILTARDDPFIDVAPFENLRPSPYVEKRILDYGGHVGFIGRDGRGGLRWAERQAADWVTKENEEGEQESR